MAMESWFIVMILEPATCSETRTIWYCCTSGTRRHLEKKMYLSHEVSTSNNLPMSPFFRITILVCRYFLVRSLLLKLPFSSRKSVIQFLMVAKKLLTLVCRFPSSQSLPVRADTQLANLTNVDSSQVASGCMWC